MDIDFDRCRPAAPARRARGSGNRSTTGSGPEAPVWQIPGQDTFLVSDPALVREAVGRPDDFSSNLVSLLHDDGTGCPVPYRMAPLGDPVHVLATA